MSADHCFIHRSIFIWYVSTDHWIPEGKNVLSQYSLGKKRIGNILFPKFPCSPDWFNSEFPDLLCRQQRLIYCFICNKTAIPFSTGIFLILFSFKVVKMKPYLFLSKRCYLFQPQCFILSMIRAMFLHLKWRKFYFS